MAATQQALLMASDNAVTVPEACEADPYYSCGPTNDPYWANVVLMLHMDGTDGSTTFVDSSPAARTIAAFSSAQVDTANKKFGTGSGYFPTGTNSYLTTGDGYDMPGDFTVEFWLRLDTVTRIGQILFALTSPSSSNHFYIVAQTNGTTSSIGVAVGSATINDLTYDLVANTWYHIAVARSGSTVTLFKNGVERGTTTTTFSPLSTRVGQVGYEVGTGNSLYGYIDDLRITKGVARYTGNFNIPTAAFPDALETVWDPADPRTVLSLHADDVTVEDSSCYQPKTITLSGTLGNIAEVTDAESKFGGKSFYIPNSGASTTAGIIVTDHMDLDFGTGDFTIEMWAYRTANTYYGTLFYGTYGGEFSLIVAPTTGNIVLNYRSSGGTQANISTGVTFPLTTWQHVVVQRRGTNFEFYLDGVLGNTTAITGGASSTVNSTGDFYFGRTNASSALTWAGYIDEVRITKGVARIANPNLPTEAFPDNATDDPYWANVVVAMHFDGDLVDEKGHAFSADGTTFTSSGKFADAVDIGGTAVTGGGSNVVYLDTATTDLWLDGGDFTIEGWIKNNATDNNRPRSLVALKYGSDDYARIGINETGETFVGLVRTGVSTTSVISTAIVATTGVWFHVALTRNGDTYKYFVNGIDVGSTTTSSYRIASQNISCFVGNSARSFVDALCGQIDDLRITKGVARYPTSFTPPAQPNCDSVVPGSTVSVPGTSPLTGMSVTVRQQTIGDQNGAVALSGVSATVNAGGLFSDSVTSSKTVALLGRSVTVSRGTLAVPAYPNLISVSTTTIEAVATGNTAKLTFTFFTDGTYTVVDQALTTRTSGTWIDTAQTNYSIPAISNQYRVVTINIFAGTSYTYSTLPFTLGTSFSVVIQNLASSTLNIFDFQLTISPTSTNPRYAEPYYYGTHRFKAVLSNDMS